MPSVIVREVDSSTKRVLDASQLYIDDESLKVDTTKETSSRYERARLNAEKYDQDNKK